MVFYSPKILIEKCSLCFFLLLMAYNCLAQEIAYEIYDHTQNSEGELIAKGVKKYTLTDISVIKKTQNNEISWTKSLHLQDGFKIGLSIYKEPDITGFGLWAKNSPCSFSWEWFSATNSVHYNTFKKLQEGGMVSVNYQQEKGLKEIISVKFITDISLRLNQTRKEVGGITHRVLIKKGSVLELNRKNASEPTAIDSKKTTC